MNISFINTYIDTISLHYVGNKLTDDGIIISKTQLKITDDLKKLLTHYFVSNFKSQEYFQLYHETDIKYNEVYGIVGNIFEDSHKFHINSIDLAKFLYEQSTHPKIKSGEFYVVYLRNCEVDGDNVAAIGLFKSENKDTFLQIHSHGDDFEIESLQGININKLDKGCLIFNTDKENGYLVSVVDNTNRQTEAQYWIDDFLHIRQRKDEYYNTQNMMSMTRSFVMKEMPQTFVDVSKADQADILTRSMEFFKEKESFKMEEFANEVMSQPEVIDSFNRYKEVYEREQDVEILDNFEISDSAVKKQARVFKSVIKLDKNFHIYVHGNNQYIKKGYDESTGMYYYQLFFKEEL